MRLLLFILITGLSFASYSQLELRDSLIFNSTIDSNRLIYNLSDPQLQGSALNAHSVISGQLKFGKVSGGGVNDIDLIVSPALAAYEPGMSISFFAPGVNDSSVQININNLGAKTIYQANGMPLDSATFASNLGVKVIFDGDNFVLISTPNRSCPAGFIDVNDRYCIQVNEQDTINYWNAVVHCGDLDAKLCTWSEWYLACAKLGNQLNDMTDNWEYIDAAQNYISTYISKSGAKVIGNGLCETSAYSNPETNWGFRCCYKK